MVKPPIDLWAADVLVCPSINVVHEDVHHAHIWQSRGPDVRPGFKAL